jgi:hypothetical protein
LNPKGWPVDADEDLLRTLLAAILRGMAGRTTNPTGLPDLIVEEIVAGRYGSVKRVALWPLLKAAAAVGYDVQISIFKGDGDGRVSLQVEG